MPSHPPAKTVKLPYKEWLAAEAAKIGIKPHALAVRLSRGRHAWPAGLVRGRTRATYVRVPVASE